MFNAKFVDFILFFLYRIRDEILLLTNVYASSQGESMCIIIPLSAKHTIRAPSGYILFFMCLYCFKFTRQMTWFMWQIYLEKSFGYVSERAVKESFKSCVQYFFSLCYTALDEGGVYFCCYWHSMTISWYGLRYYVPGLLFKRDEG